MHKNTTKRYRPTNRELRSSCRGIDVTGDSTRVISGSKQNNQNEKSSDAGQGVPVNSLAAPR